MTVATTTIPQKVLDFTRSPEDAETRFIGLFQTYQGVLDQYLPEWWENIPGTPKQRVQELEYQDLLYTVEMEEGIYLFRGYAFE